MYIKKFIVTFIPYILSAQTYTYNQAGNLTGVTYPNGKQLGYTYDKSSNLLTVSPTIPNDNGSSGNPSDSGNSNGETTNENNNSTETPSTKTLTLTSDWNLVSLQSNNLNTLFDTNNVLLWKYTNSAWQIYSNNPTLQQSIDNQNFLTFSELNNLEGVWIYTNSSFNIEFEQENRTTPPLQNGWQLNATGATMQTSELTCQNGDFRVAWKYNAGDWEIYNPKNLRLNNTYTSLDFS